MQPRAEGPAVGLRAFEELLELQYFDFLACLGQSSLHPGGLRATAAVLDTAGLAVGESVVEIGCGTGMSTRLILMEDVVLTVVEPSERVLAAAQHYLREGGCRMPTWIRGDAENLTAIADSTIDLVLYESVLGFVRDKRRAVGECRRVLRPGGRIGVNDFHYVARPSATLLAEMQEVCGLDGTVMTKDYWMELFGGTRVVLWNERQIEAVPVPTRTQVSAMLEQCTFLEELPAASGCDRVGLVLRRWAQFERVFGENRQLMRAHSAVFATD